MPSGEHEPPGSGQPLTQAERLYLDAHSRIPENERTTTDAAARPNRPERKAFTVRQVANLLHATVKDVRQRIHDGDIRIAFNSAGNELRAPHWQFVDGRLIPHLATVVPALGLETDTMIEGFFTHAEVEDDRVYGVAEWLLRGGDPQRVIDLRPDVSI